MTKNIAGAKSIIGAPLLFSEQPRRGGQYMLQSQSVNFTDKVLERNDMFE